MDRDTETVHRKALGRGAALGDLYDVRQDSFCGVSLLNSAPPEAAITSQDIPEMYCEYTTEHKYQDKFNKLNIEAGLQISVLFDLFSLSGSGQYLKDEGTSQKVVRGTLIYKISTKEDRINLHHDALRQHVIAQQFHNSKATHVVSKISWGATVFVTFEKKVEKHTQEKEIAGMLAVKLSETISAVYLGERPSLDGCHANKNEHEVDSFSIKVHGDVIPNEEPVPQSVDQVQQLISKIPQYIAKFNHGKGKPVEIELYPVKLLAEHFGKAIQEVKLKNEIPDAMIRRVEWEIDNVVSQKQILNDFVAEVRDFSEHVSQKDLTQCNEYHQSVNNADAEFRDALRHAVLDIRQNGAATSVLDHIIDSYHQNPHCVSSISAFMGSKEALKVKMGFFQVMKSKNVQFLPKFQSIDDFVAQHNKQDIYVLYYNSEMLGDDEKWSITYQVFLDRLEEGSEGVGTNILSVPAPLTSIDCAPSNSKSVLLNPPKFLVVDVALPPPARGLVSSVTRIAQYSNGRIVTDDVVQDKCCAVTHNIIKWSRIDKFGLSTHKVAVARLICPLGIQSKCSSERRQWVCHRCNDTMLYNFLGHFYCNCGGVLLQDCQFKCSDPQHGFQFSSFVNLETLKRNLPKVAESDFINILLLGQSGVGKTTFINALRNYFEYATLGDAIQGGVKVLIPSQFRHGDYTVKVGEADSREACTLPNQVGQSSTQSCGSHYFSYREKLFQIIDTPGIGDVRGFAQDKQNTENILAYIAKEEHLHGICILLKPNESGLTIEFRFCITSLLTNIHRHAVNNIMFCYTHASTTSGTMSYAHGDTHVLVRELISNIEKVHRKCIPYEKKNTFFFDSEIFRFLACLQQKIVELPTDALEQALMSRRWDRGVQETIRLLETVVNTDPHFVSETLSLNDARMLLKRLSRPLAEIGQTIASNMAQIENHVKNINAAGTDESQMQACLMRNVEVLQTIKLDYPRTVCTAQKCTKIVDGQVEFSAICHDHGYVRFLPYDTIGSWLLTTCRFMLWNGKCKACHCSYTAHQRIAYTTRRVLVEKKNEMVEKLMKENRSAMEIKKSVIENLVEDNKQLESEMKKLTTECARFAVFLQENAITPFDDSIDRYLKRIIEQRRRLEQLAVVSTLERLRDEYHAEKDFYEAFLAASESSENDVHNKLMATDIPTVVAELEKLRVAGPLLREIREVSEQS